MSTAIQSRQSTLETCIQACFDCLRECETCGNACLSKDKAQVMALCIKLCRDCADLCALCLQFMFRNSEFHAQGASH